VIDTVREFVRRDLRAAVVPWALARVLVVGSLALTRFGVDHLEDTRRPTQLDQGLFAWDAAFYRDIAENGYGAVRSGALRFFPLVPLMARGLGVVFVGNDAVALIFIANGSALLFGGFLYRLTRIEAGDPRAAVRAAWFAAIFPPAMALVLGYAEATFMLLSVAMFLALRRRRFAWAAPFGVLAGLTRPVGVLLAIPAAIEAARTWRVASARDRVARVGAVIAGPVGSGLYLLWVRYAYDDAWLPLRIQNERAHRGGTVDPFTRTFDGIGDLIRGDRFGSGLHILWAVLFVVLIVVLFQRLPSSYGAYAAVMVVVNLSARNLDSFERYAMSAFPLVLAVALVTARPDVERPVLAASAAGLVGYSVLGFLGVYVP
jgi:hypothetical protein